MWPILKNGDHEGNRKDHEEPQISWQEAWVVNPCSAPVFGQILNSEPVPRPRVPGHRGVKSM